MIDDKSLNCLFCHLFRTFRYAVQTSAESATQLFVIGVDSESDCSSKDVCNGPLKPGKTYRYLD